ncbi:MAG: S-adenosylmethionine:tRNA ribosyltransferase-isomerase [Bacteroidetes bacterium]|jgi:S-adenosylmethionine:tRNA ribosyltransferase-isomerase|nr:S-adenosylmethionine:tRNA ribosyltransferase-isomerase [Bacteroidota bacterium]
MDPKELARNIDINEYEYNLPEDRIAQYPAEKRDHSMLLVHKNGKIRSDKFTNIYKYLPPDTMLVFNNTRVIRARILFRKKTGSSIEIFCLEPILPATYDQSLGSHTAVEWKCLVGNLKKWKTGTLSTSFFFNNKEFKLNAEKIRPSGQAMIIRFSWEPEETSFGRVIESVGHIPLPPYVKRDDDEHDYLRYQTVFSAIDGSVAAPTAGLHFTKDLLDKIVSKGILCTELTLHTGAGTFRPVKTNDLSLHEMHCEHYIITRKLIELLLENRNKVIACGTTSVRTLESIYWLGIKLLSDPGSSGLPLFTDQWEPYGNNSDITVEESLKTVLRLFHEKNCQEINASTKLMIIPGYEFRMITGMITNFHLPKSTLLLLLSAWTGPEWKKIYKFALENNYRFLSYGDGSLLMK